MNYYQKIPPILDSIYNFFNKHATFIVKDIVDITTTRRKFKLIESAKKFFEQKKKLFLLSVESDEIRDNMNIYGCFDVMEFGQCCLVGIYEDTIIIYSASNESFYWGNQIDFFVNGTKCFPIERTNNRIFENNNNMIPDPLVYGLFRSYNFDQIKITDEHIINLHNNIKNNYLIHHES